MLVRLVTVVTVVVIPVLSHTFAERVVDDVVKLEAKGSHHALEAGVAAFGCFNAVVVRG
jgi:hypothetical protein